MSAHVYSAPSQTEGTRKVCWSGKAYPLNYPLNYLLHVSEMLTIIRVFIILFLLARIYREHSGNVQNKSVSSPFSWVSRYLLSLAKLKRRRRPFLEGARRGSILWNYPQEHLVVIRDEQVSPFVKFGIILPLLFLLDPLINKHCRTCSSMINLRTDSRTCQK